MKHTLDKIGSLGEKQIFVFESNEQGRHEIGDSLLAMLNFDANEGQGRGRQGRSYAIPTYKYKDGKIQPLSLDSIFMALNELLLFAHNRPDLEFLVTKIGTGPAGYKIKEIAELFTRHLWPENMILPEEYSNDLS